MHAFQKRRLCGGSIFVAKLLTQIGAKSDRILELTETDLLFIESKEIYLDLPRKKRKVCFEWVEKESLIPVSNK